MGISLYNNVPDSMKSWITLNSLKKN